MEPLKQVPHGDDERGTTPNFCIETKDALDLMLYGELLYGVTHGHTVTVCTRLSFSFLHEPGYYLES